MENTLLDLLDGIDKKQSVFDRLIIECTGMVNPGSITQIFLIFQGVQRLYSADWDRQWQEGEAY